ncbi:MAG: VOC family protein, partial [Chloroflexi bacterium]|nr:VOC family protein [Chloroflexota bacterium]
MQVRELGHAVIKVRNRERSEQFYGDVLGMKLAARHEQMPMTFYTLGNHHDLALLEVGEDGPETADPKAPGLYHLAFCIGDTLEELKAARDELEAAGVQVFATIDHTVSQSLYLNDPDGNG